MYVMNSLSHNFLKKHSKYVAPKHDLVQLIDDYWLGSSLTIKSSSSWSRDQTIQYTYQYRSLIQKKMDSTTWNKCLVSQILLGHFTEEYSFRWIIGVVPNRHKDSINKSAGCDSKEINCNIHYSSLLNNNHPSSL